MKNWSKIVPLLFFVFLMAADALSAEVKNERVRQDGNQILFEYDLEGEKEAEVLVSITAEGRRYTSKELHLEGDYGKVKSGKNRRVYWNVLQDFPRGLHGNFEAEISADGMVFVKGGCFDMGWDDDYGTLPNYAHQVCVDDFYMGKYEVTQREWREVMGSNPSHFKDCDNCPVERVSWNDVQEYISKLNNKTGQNYRLPTEAEWEYAARSGGKKEKWAGTSNGYELGDYVWYDKNADSKTHPVGQKRPNGLGLYDMSGNVWEWVQDWYVDSSYYRNSPKDNPAGPSSGSGRLYRGGCWFNGPVFVRSDVRSSDTPDIRDDSLGFRLVRTK